MIFTIVKCEVCENNFRFAAGMRPYERDVPPHWFTLVEGNPQHKEGLHFCSKPCLKQWLEQVEPKAEQASYLKQVSVEAIWVVTDERGTMVRAKRQGVWYEVTRVLKGWSNIHVPANTLALDNCPLAEEEL